ncbi:MAG TPA: hypothetical protein VF815_35165 [Myxococcaceae bacterium]|jgi:hypothetical protein
MPLRSLPLLALLLFLSAASPAASQPAAPSAPAPQRVLLRWKVPQGTAVGYELIRQQLSPGISSMRVGISSLKQSGVTKQQRVQVYQYQPPSESAMTAVLTAKPSGDLSAKVVVTRVELPKKKRPTKQDRQVANAFRKDLGKVHLRGNLTDWGFVTTDLKREQRNLLALMFELPSKPVAVGEVWSHSSDLVKMGDGWVGEIEHLNRVELASLEKDAEGRLVAVIDYTLAERQEGKFSGMGLKGEIPASVEMAFVGRGEFLVEEGKWKRLAGRMTTKAAGAMETDSEHQITLTPLETIPPKVLAAE